MCVAPFDSIIYTLCIKLKQLPLYPAATKAPMQCKMNESL